MTTKKDQVPVIKGFRALFLLAKHYFWTRSDSKSSTVVALLAPMLIGWHIGDIVYNSGSWYDYLLLGIWVGLWIVSLVTVSAAALTTLISDFYHRRAEVYKESAGD